MRSVRDCHGGIGVEHGDDSSDLLHFATPAMKVDCKSVAIISDNDQGSNCANIVNHVNVERQICNVYGSVNSVTDHAMNISSTQAPSSGFDTCFDEYDLSCNYDNVVNDNFCHVTGETSTAPSIPNGMFTDNDLLSSLYDVSYTNVDGVNIIPMMCDDILRTHNHLVGGRYSQMNYDCWDYYLGYESDSDIRNYLDHGILFGFPIVDTDSHIEKYRCSNYTSVMSGQAFEYVNDLILKEIDSGKYLRAISPPHCVHALGAVPKSDGSYRPITDCKRPLGQSINNYMKDTFHEFSYCTVDQVASHIKPGCYMASVDIASAYRSVPIHPDHWTYQAVAWPIDGMLSDLLDTHISFGLRCAPYIFTTISNFVSATMDRLGYCHVINYIDDFLVYGESFEQCQEAQTILIHLLGQLGFHVSWKKCTSPATSIRYLGIIFDSISMEMSVPQDKLDKLHSEIKFFDNKSRATKRQIQRLCGILSHCAKVIKGGRTFSRRVIDLLKGLPEGNPRIRLSQDFKDDLTWWKEFAKLFNGKEKFLLPTPPVNTHVYTDSCLKGYGLVVSDDWQAGYFDSDVMPHGYEDLVHSHGHWKNVLVPDMGNINFLELVPVREALYRFAEQWSDQHVMLFSDNTQVVSMINKGFSQNKYSMRLLREMFWIMATHNIYLTSRHIPGHLNTLPDLLSRVYDDNCLSSLNNFGLCCR